MTEQVLVIVWKWQHLNGREAIRAEFPVEGNGKKIIQVNEVNSKEARDRLKSIINDEYPTADIILLLHRNHLYTNSDIFHLQSATRGDDREVRCYLFGDGLEYIYYDYFNKSGLLDNEGKLMNKSMYFVEELKKDGTKETIPVEARVVQSLADEPEVKAIFFDKVWRYYFFPLKRVLSDFQQRLLIYLVPKLMMEGEKGEQKILWDWLPTPLQKEMKTIFEEEISEERIMKLYAKDQSIRQNFVELKTFLETTPFSIEEKDAFLKKARLKFRDLLLSIPQPV